MSNKEKKYLLISVYLFALIFMLFGFSFAYFTARDKSQEKALDVTSGQLHLSLEIAQKYPGKKLIPTDDTDIMKAYNNKCVDDNGSAACDAYDLIITNDSATQDIIGNIDFTINHIKNLSYLVLDEEGNIYQDITKVPKSTDDMPLGGNFILDGAIETGTVTSRKFTLIIWLSNLNQEQNDESGGTYSASIEYSSIYGQKLSSSVSGEES